MGCLARIQLSAMSLEDEREFEDAVAKMHDRYASLLHGWRELSRNETRRMLREQDLSLSALPELYAIEVPSELLDVPRRYGEKLGKALYYLHSGRIVPSSGGVRVRVMTGAHLISPRFPWAKLQILGGRPVLTRSGKALDDQFSYRYAIPSEGGGAAFMVKFRQSLGIMIFVYEAETSDFGRRVVALGHSDPDSR